MERTTGGFSPAFHRENPPQIQSGSFTGSRKEICASPTPVCRRGPTVSQATCRSESLPTGSLPAVRSLAAFNRRRILQPHSGGCRFLTVRSASAGTSVTRVNGLFPCYPSSRCHISASEITVISLLLIARLPTGRTLAGAAIAAGMCAMPYQRGQFWIGRFRKHAESLCVAGAAPGLRRKDWLRSPDRIVLMARIGCEVGVPRANPNVFQCR